LPSLDLLFNFI